MYEAVVPEQKKILNAELAVVVGADAENVPSSIVAVLVDVCRLVVEKEKEKLKHHDKVFTGQIQIRVHTVAPLVLMYNLR